MNRFDQLDEVCPPALLPSAATAWLNSYLEENMTNNDFLPVLDPAPLLHLVEDVGLEAAQGFFRTYLQLLPVRTVKLACTLFSEDRDEALDAVLSLKTTSDMIGAMRLASVCNDFAVRLRSGLPIGRSVTANLFEQELMILEHAGSVRVPAEAP